ncbi:MAG TPA: (Fe-S)-binding protein [Dissulfurispiraceae bacterium]|nr:(Fe-S)-binding protein [Dissulfurispiraceae bacterium]
MGKEARNAGRPEDWKDRGAEGMDSSTSELPGLRAPELSLCVKCGNCKSHCPTYAEFMNEGMSARGRVSLLKRLLSGDVDPSDSLDARIFSCLLCGSCDGLCPLGISITNAVYEGRRKLTARKKHWLFRVATNFVFMDPARSVRIFKLLEEHGLLPYLNHLRIFKTIADFDIKIPVGRLRDGATIFKVQNPKGRIGLFTGCTVDCLYPPMGLSLIYALNALDYEVVLPKGEACCGAPLLGAGLKKEFDAVAEKNLNAFLKLKAEAVISLCPTCTYFIRDKYPKAIGDGIANAMDISSFLLDLESEAFSTTVPEPQGTVVYHDPCHSRNYLGIAKEPREILRRMGFGVVEQADQGCCGLGGTVRLLHEEVSGPILENRVKSLTSERTDMIVTSCPNCVLQLSSAIKDRPVKHIIEIVAANMKRRI